MRPMTHKEMQALLTYLVSCQPSGTEQVALAKAWREAWGVGDVTATQFLATELVKVASKLEI